MILVLGRLSILLCTVTMLHAEDALADKLAALDHEVFESYNNCEVDKFASFFAEDVEFYHDQTGLMAGRQNLVNALKNNICGKVRRELVKESLQAYPLKGYGAVQMGVHRFHHPGAEEREPVGEAKFIHLWQEKDGMWKITRVISYNHESLKK